jgi:3-deoxy-D-manno-octulosonic-acid transferase
VPSTSIVYRTAIRIGAALAPAFARERPKLAHGLAVRRGVVGRLEEWARVNRDPARPLLWMHAPSVGEGLQAEAVLLALRERHPEWQIAYTHFSPSAEPLAGRQPADIADYLPWDRPRDVIAALGALRPAALVFSKLDLWPELATRAAARGTAVGIIAATVTPGSGRLRWPARVLLRPGYRSVTLAGAIAEADATRLAALGVPISRIEITGDPRFDSALQRARAIAPDDPLLRFGHGAPTLVAGSTWPEDEEVLLRAFRAVRATQADARLIIVPHEPTPEHLAGLDRMVEAEGLGPAARLSAASNPVPVLVVDRTGILATLYRAGDLAYVGGGFGRAGLHSVLEPAACGLPVLFGPRWQESQDAALLLADRAAVAVTLDFPDWLDLDTEATHAGSSPLAALWLALLRNPGHARAAGRRALECVEAGTGAAARSAGLVERLMQQGAASAR